MRTAQSPPTFTCSSFRDTFRALCVEHHARVSTGNLPTRPFAREDGIAYAVASSACKAQAGQPASDVFEVNVIVRAGWRQQACWLCQQMLKS